jgi:hypothetical protein
MDIADSKDPSRINWSKEILPMVDMSQKSLDKHKKYMFGKIVEYLEEVEGINVSRKTLKELRLAEDVAKKFWRRKFATWMLAPMRGVKVARRV